MRGFRCSWLAVLLSALVTACGTTQPSQSRPAGIPSNAPPAREITLLPLDQQRIAAHLAALQQIAAQHHDARTAGTAGYEASVDYVADQLRQMSYRVTTPTVDFSSFREEPGSRLELADGQSFDDADFKPMIYSAGADVTAPVSLLADGACDASAFRALQAGAIAVVPNGRCFERDSIADAEAADAAAIVVVRDQWTHGKVLRPTLRSASGVDIPVLAADAQVGEALEEAATRGSDVRLHVRVDITPTVIHNVIAESSSPGGRLVMLGAHLDSVHDGPGLNDNGSGVAAALEIARLLSSGVPGATIRIGFWAAEEYGLIGSTDYVNDLVASGGGLPVAYLNLDMIGSPNPVPFVYADAQAADGSEAITEFLAGAFAAAGVAAERTDVGGASDHLPFEQAGVPTGGVFSGATELKSELQVRAYGGVLGAPMDACYHLACDTVANVDVAETARNGSIAATALRALADGSLLP